MLKKRRALDSNQRIPYDIGSLANCWFKPLTQPSLNHLFCKRAVQIYNYFSNLQNLLIYLAISYFKNGLFFLLLRHRITYKIIYYEKTINTIGFGMCIVHSDCR